jgi:hypothetical protein
VQNLSYERYLEDPRVRAEIEAEVVRLKHLAVDQFIVQPVRTALGKLRRRPARRSTVPALPSSSTWQTTLKAHETLVLDNAKGLAIESLGGSLWITQEHDSKDHVLGAGEVFRVRRNGTTIVYATKGASIRVACDDARAAESTAAAAVSPRRRHARSAAAALVQVFRTGAVRVRLALASVRRSTTAAG